MKDSMVKPYEKACFAPKPTWIVRFMRKNIFFQIYRFTIINLKMVKVIWNSHK